MDPKLQMIQTFHSGNIMRYNLVQLPFLRSEIILVMYCLKSESLKHFSDVECSGYSFSDALFEK